MGMFEGVRGRGDRKWREYREYQKGYYVIECITRISEDYLSLAHLMAQRGYTPLCKSAANTAEISSLTAKLYIYFQTIFVAILSQMSYQQHFD
jgi:hypothetical protein